MEVELGVIRDVLIIFWVIVALPLSIWRAAKESMEKKKNG